MSYHALGSWLTEGPATQMFQQAMLAEYKKDPSKTDVMNFLIDEGLLNPDGTLTEKGKDRADPIGESIKDISNATLSVVGHVIPWWIWVGLGLFVSMKLLAAFKEFKKA